MKIASNTRLFLLLLGCAAPLTSQTEKKKEGRPTLEVRAMLVDQAGRPIEGVGVRFGTAAELFHADALRDPLVRSDASGRVRFPVERQDYSTVGYDQRFALFVHPKYASVRVGVMTNYYGYNPWNRGGQQSTGQGIDLGRIALTPGGTLRGRVRGAGGRPLAGARVVARELLASGYYARFSNQYGMQNPLHVSQARTDDKGRFELRGVFPEGMSLRIHAPGYFDHRVPFVAARRAIDIAMEPSGFIAGKVIDGAGKPRRAIVYMRYETVSYAQDEVLSLIRTDKDGRFRVTRAARGRYSVYVQAVTKPGDPSVAANSDAYSESRSDIEIELAAPADEKKPITVEVVAKATGEKVTGAKGVVLWQDPRYLNTAALQNSFQNGAVAAKEDGTIELAAPRNRQPPKGGVLVKAEGFAPGVEKKIEYDEEKPPRIKIELEKESIVRGVVVDEKTGKPLAFARVMISPAGTASGAMMMSYLGYAPQTGNAGTQSDDNGRFELRGLAKGKYDVTASLTERPESKVQRVELKVGETRGGVRMLIPRGVSLSGKVFFGFDEKGAQKPAKLDGSWQVRLGGNQNNGYYPGIYSSRLSFGYSGYGYGAGQLQAGPVPLGADGSFRFENLGAGRYRFNLMAPPLGKRGRPVLSTIEPLRLRKKDMIRDFDASEDLPGVVRGRVKVTGVPFPMSRLFVLSVPVSSGGKRPSRVYFNLNYFRCVVEEDGTFAFRVPKGHHHIYFMDGAYSTVLFHAQKPVEVKFDAPAQVDYEIPLTRVRVRLRPEIDGGQIVVGRLEWLPSHPGDVVDTSFGNYEQGYGQVVCGQEEFFLVVPPVKVSFVARSYAFMIDPKGGHSYAPSAEGEVIARLGQLETLDLKIRRPVDLTNPAPPPKAGANAADGGKKPEEGTAKER